MGVKELYCCWNYHHILISSILAMKKESEADIILIQKYHSIDKNIIDNLEKSNIFDNTYVFEEEMVKFSKRRNILAYLYNRYFRLFQYYNKNFPVNITLYSDRYLYVDFDSVAPYFMLKKVPFHLIEDAKNVFSKETFKKLPASSRVKYIYPTGITKILEKTGIIFPIYGNSQYCLDIAVNSLDDLIITDNNKSKFKLLSEKDLLSSLTDENIDLLFDIFGRNFRPEKTVEYSIIITEPLYEDKRIGSFDDQIKCYKTIIDSYCQNVHTIIKPHPRDNCDYSSLLSDNVTIIAKTFPSELLSLIPMNQVRKFITVSSSAVLSYPADKQIFLGEEYINFKGGR